MMLWRRFFSVFLILWIQDLASCEKAFETCSFYYWRVDWKRAVEKCEEEKEELLCYKSKKVIEDITYAFRLGGAAELEIWLSRKDCSSNEMDECLSLHIEKSNTTVWHFVRTKCGEKYPFICCTPRTGEETTWPEDNTTTPASNREEERFEQRSGEETTWPEDNTTTPASNRTADIFDITSSSLLTTTYTSSTMTLPFCKGIQKRGIFWPNTNAGEISVRPCPGNSMGLASWVCEKTDSGKWKEDGPDMKKCRSLEIQNLKKRFNTTAASNIILELEHIFGNRNTEIFGEDLTDIISLMTTLPDRLFQELESLTSSAMWVASRGSVEKTLSVIDRMVELNATWYDIDKGEKSKAGTYLLSTVEGMGKLLAHTMLNKAKDSIIGRNMAMQVMKPIRGEAVTSSYSHRGGVQLETGYDTKLKPEDGNVSLIFALYTDMSNILSPPENEKNETSCLNSAVFSATVSQNMKSQPINKPVRILVEHLTSSPNQTACVFWNMHLNEWDTAGCRLESSNASFSVCICDHLTNFALIMDYGKSLNEVDQLPFHYITVVGCSLSIVCLAICVIIFSCYSYHSRHSWGLRYVIHRNLCLTLLVANLVLVLGLDRTDNQKACAVTAGLLHYFFLSAFCWMLLEGVHIYLLLVVVFASRRSHSERYYLFGYGVPLIIVVTTAISRPTYYGTNDICWLSSEKGTIWAFLGPIAAILVLNIAALVLAQYKASKISVKDDKAALLKRWLRVTFILFPVLGITWIFGFLYFGKYFEVAGYLFAICNSFQGVCIFVFHCLLDKKARNMILDSFRKRNTSINTGSSGTQKKAKDQLQNGIKSNSIAPIEDNLDKISRPANTFQLPNPKKDWWAKCRKPWSFCFEMPVASRHKNSGKEQERPQAVVVKWNSLRDKNSS